MQQPTKQLSICFYGSSDYGLDSPLAVLHNDDIVEIVSQVLELEFDSFQVITGGYGGIMDLVAQEFKKQAKVKDKTIQIVGITCDAYEFEDPNDKSKKYEKSNDYSLANDIVIQAESFPARIQAMIELSDLFIVLPGKQGTLSEFLITADAYAYPIEILANKNYKILVHEYWKPLLTQDFYREFDGNVLFYFNKENLIEFLSGVELGQSAKIIQEEPYKNVPLDNIIQSKFIKLKNGITKIILGKLYDTATLSRIGIENDSPLLGLDFGWFLTNQSKNEKGGFLSYSTPKYVNHTQEFFLTHNSIMLGKFENEFKVAYTNGKLQSKSSLSLYTDETIPKKDENKTDSDFGKLKDFFENQKEYGQTLIWKGFKVAVGSGSDEIIFSVFILLNYKIPSRKIEKIRQLTDDFLLTVSSIKAGELFKEKDENLKRQASKSAISQVMARNMSHNIGSHVLSRMITAESMTTEKLLNDEQQYIPIFNNDGSKYEDEIAFFNSYLKTRMDYLADIATSTPTMQNSKLFKNEIMNGFDKNRILLNRISGIKNFEFEIKIVFKDENDEEIISPTHDFNVAISNDVMGQHALYIILENIIRNTAKHGSVKNGILVDSVLQPLKSKVQFTIQIKECEADSTFYEVTIYDDCLITGGLFNVNELETEKERKKYKDLFQDIYTEVLKLQKLVYDQNYRLNESVLDEKTMALRHGSWGLIEMDVSAAYLRKIPIEDVDLDKYQIPLTKKQSCDFKLKPDRVSLRILEAVVVPTESARHLGYRFYLPKPKEILVIDESGDTWDELFRKEDNSIDEKFLRELCKQGILFLSIKENAGEWLYKPEGSDYSHETLLLLNAKDAKNYEKPSLPFKLITKKYFDKYYIHYYNSLYSTLKDIFINPHQAIVEIHRALLYKKMNEEEINSFSPTSSPNGRINIDNNNPQYCYRRLNNLNGKIFEIQFSHHGGGLVRNLLEGKVVNNYFEAYSSEVKSLVNKSSPKDGRGNINSNFDEKTTISLLWSTLSNVVILDERIQEQVEKGTYKPENENEVELRKIFEKMNIIVPSSGDFNLSAHSYQPKSNYIEYIASLIDKAIQNNTGRGIKNVDFIVIHLGVIEKIRKAQNLPKEKEDIKAFKSELEHIYPNSRIIVTSGRGKPDNLPDDICFLGYSILSQYTLESRLKYLLVNALNSSRPKNE